ncbi:ribonuclease II family protein [Schizosaccharomyces cryophilus OY26]|uniref:Ribonuclease II family protein n=1 Tax=Schizosaccharomyces cryophilus (strain OY26 / ATCC MYA-4695 / CBS 11777 / NBRC 106824 / NRRL Y48691) TaxID=653667 RepID=S9XJY9_SCHCR|nr:ribonuclease II family protein [Schizosaccharomyces cryophilus OY26]EPY54016.1 ribonuclease II family protein [Schizosaccharomyces cryophilus OY26]
MDPHWKQSDPSGRPPSSSSSQKMGGLAPIAPDVIQSQIEYLQALQMQQQSLTESENYTQANLTSPFQANPFSNTKKRESLLLPRLNPIAPIGARQMQSPTSGGPLGPAEVQSPSVKTRTESLFSPAKDTFDTFSQSIQSTSQRANMMGGMGVIPPTRIRRRSSVGNESISPVSPKSANFLTSLKPIEGNFEWQQSPMESPLSAHSLQESIYMEPESPTTHVPTHMPLSTASQQSYINHSTDGASLPQSSFLNFNNSGKRVSVSAAAQQHKNLFLPYLPQASLPKFISTGRLLVGTLHINRKNRSDAYVITDALDEYIFICGSKDRNRTLEGDLVAVELLDVNEIMQTKREKEEKKIRRNLSLSGTSKSSVNSKAKMMSISTPMALGMNKGALAFERSIEKRKNDYEVTGQSLSFVDDISLNQENLPRYAGHIVAILDRPSGDTCSGTLALYRPNSLASKNQSSHRRNSSTSSGEGGKGPKIVWFKPSDKRIPLIAISSDQVPPRFFTNNEEFKDQVFLAGIKRWPTTSLHPFGTLYESIGKVGDPKVEFTAILHDYSCRVYEFPESLSYSVKRLSSPIPSEELKSRYDLRDKLTFMVGTRDYAIHIDTGSSEGIIILGFHVTDVASSIKQDMPIDDEAANRVSQVQLVQGSVPFLPKRVTEEVSLITGHDCLTISIVIQLDLKSETVIQCSLGPSVISPSSYISLETAQANMQSNEALQLLEKSAKVLTKLRLQTKKDVDLQSLYCFGFRDDQLSNIQELNMNVFKAPPVVCALQQIEHWINEKTASHLMSIFPNKVVLRRNARPKNLDAVVRAAQRAGLHLTAESSSMEFMTALATTNDKDLQRLLQLNLKRLASESEYTVGTSNDKDVSHFAFASPCYTHFCHPTRRYIDICVQRQLHEAFEGRPDFSKDYKSLLSVTQSCNTLSNFYRYAQEKSIHAKFCEASQIINSRSGLIEHKAIVIATDQSYIDLVVYELGLERRMYLDLLPLNSCEYNGHTEELTFSWRKNTPSFYYATSSLEIDSTCYNDFKKKYLDSGGVCKHACNLKGCGLQDLIKIAESGTGESSRDNLESEAAPKSNEDAAVERLQSLRIKEPEFVQKIRPGQQVDVFMFADTSSTYSLSLITLKNPFSE